jgi:hypothetical protein
MSKWIEFVNLGVIQGHKTANWRVITKDGRSLLGEVKWFGRWRCYSFFPQPDCVFEKQCLRDIAEFCDAQTTAHRLRSPRLQTKDVDAATGTADDHHPLISGR